MKKRRTNERKVQKLENVGKAAKTLTMHTSVALIPVKNCFCWIFESFFFFLKRRTHSQRSRESKAHCNQMHSHYSMYTTFVHPLYSNYTCANKLHWNNEAARENILFGMAATAAVAASANKEEKNAQFQYDISAVAGLW